MTMTQPSKSQERRRTRFAWGHGQRCGDHRRSNGRRAFVRSSDGRGGQCLCHGADDGTAGPGRRSPDDGRHVGFYVAKFDSSGQHLWSKSFGGTGNDRAFGIALDRSGNVWVGGSFYGNITLGGNMLTSAGNGDLFLLSLGAPMEPIARPIATAVAAMITSRRSPSTRRAASWPRVVSPAGTTFGGATLTSAGRTDGFLLRSQPPAAISGRCASATSTMTRAAESSSGR